MISKSTLGTVAKDQLKEFFNTKDLVSRNLFKKAFSYGGASAFVVKGVRRCGKSTLLMQAIGEKFPGNFLYFNFDD